MLNTNKERKKMLKYLSLSVEALVAAALFVGVLRGYAKTLLGRAGNIIAGIGVLAGAVTASIMAYMKNTTAKIDTSGWNYRIFTSFTIAAAVFEVLMFVLALVRPLQKGKAGLAARIVTALPAAFMIMLIMLYSMPDVISYPYTILLVDQTAMSTDYLFKMIGLALAVIVILLCEMSVYRGMLRLSKWESIGIAAAATLTVGVRLIFKTLQIMMSKRMILPDDPNYTDYFELAKFSSNNDMMFTYILLGIVLVIPVIIVIRSFLQKEPYSNPAQKRKIKKKWRVNRRWAAMSVITAAMILVNFFVIKPYVNKPVVLSPIEDCKVLDGNVIVTPDQVEDGHLHRFAYTTPAGVDIRFIVIKKPNSQSYGIGLDACDICGETGYYERDGQVVCKLCDVVMNISTIGFKGGCNPIVVPYTIENGNIMLPVDGLIPYEKTFKS